MPVGIKSNLQRPGTITDYSAIQVPTYSGGTDYANLGGYTPAGLNSPSSDYIDDFGNRYRYQDNGNGTGQWLLVQNSSSGSALVNPSQASAVAQRRPGATGPSTTPTGNGASYNGGQTYVQPSLGGVTNPAQQQFSDFNAGNQQWQDLIGGGVIGAVGGRNAAVEQQQRDTQTYIDQLSQARGQQQGFVDTRNQQANDALGTYNTNMAPITSAIQGLNAPTWQDFNSNPADVARQQQSYDFLSGVSGGSLDYQAALADYQTYQAQLAQLYQYQSNPEDVQRQLSGLGNIEQDIQHGGDGQREVLAKIYEDLRSGGDGQRDAIERLKQELATGGTDQREVLEKYKALSNPEVTAQERYLAEIARRSFESQDRGNREAQLQDLSLRGLRSGGAEISSALASQERLGQDRTLAELGLQANAVGRSMQALQGWQGSANSLRSAQQAGLAMYTQAQSQLRAAQQQGLSLAAGEENALRQAQQQGLAMYQDAANTIRAQNDQVGLANTGWANQNSMFNANAQNDASQFNANAYNQNSMFNAGQQNQASANNQSTRLQGGISAGNMANSIRGMNDAIGMFNTSGSQASQQFAASFGLQKQGALAGINQQGFLNTNSTNDSIYNRNSDLTGMDIGNAGLGFGARTGTNGVAANAGSQNLGDILGAFGGWTSGVNTGSALGQIGRNNTIQDSGISTLLAKKPVGIR